MKNKSLILQQPEEPLRDKTYHHIFWHNGKQLRVSVDGKAWRIHTGQWMSSRGFLIEFAPVET
jgi:hypothetical protein